MRRFKLGLFWSSPPSLTLLILLKHQQNLSKIKVVSQYIRKTNLEPKGCQMCRLGPFLLTPPNLTLLVHLKHRQSLITIEIISQQIKEMKKKKKTYLRPKRHVWHCLGPFLSSPPNLTFLLKQTFIEPKQNENHQLESRKRERKKRNTYLWPNDARRVVWAYFHHRCPSQLPLGLLNVDSLNVTSPSS